MVIDTVTREPGAVGIQLSLRNMGKLGTLLENDNRLRALDKGSSSKLLEVERGNGAN